MAASSPWWAQWIFDAPAIAWVAGLTALYLRGVSVRSSRGIRRPRRTAAFLVGATIVLVAQVSPVASWSEVLLWPHMVQHLLMTVVAAPLLAASAPVATVRLALTGWPRRLLVATSRRSRRLRRSLGDPHPLLLATGVNTLSLWLWHTPSVYDAAVAHHGVHLLEHATFLVSAVWFWAEVWATARRHRRVQALATLCLGLLIVQGGALGALLTFAGRSVYDVYVGAGGLTALEDQQLGGALMWVLPGFVYASVAVRRFIAWMRAAEHELSARESAEDLARAVDHGPPSRPADRG